MFILTLSSDDVIIGLFFSPFLLAALHLILYFMKTIDLWLENKLDHLRIEDCDWFL